MLNTSSVCTLIFNVNILYIMGHRSFSFHVRYHTPLGSEGLGSGNFVVKGVLSFSCNTAIPHIYHRGRKYHVCFIFTSESKRELFFRARLVLYGLLFIFYYEYVLLFFNPPADG